MEKQLSTVAAFFTGFFWDIHLQRKIIDEFSALVHPGSIIHSHSRRSVLSLPLKIRRESFPPRSKWYFGPPSMAV
jgi:hypothetical protein